MKSWTILKGLLLTLAGVLVLLLPLLPLLAVLLARWDKVPTPGSWGDYPTIRGDVPRWLSWLQTVDERLPGGLYEPTVVRILERYGRTLCSLYWIGWRNRAHGLRRAMGRPSTEAAWKSSFKPDERGRAYGVREDGTWYWSQLFGPSWLRLVVVAGYRVYRLADGAYLAVPTATIKRH